MDALIEDPVQNFNTDALCSILDYDGICCLLFNSADHIFAFSWIFNAAYDIENIDTLFRTIHCKNSRWYQISCSTFRPLGSDEEGAILYTRKERKPEVDENG